MARLKYKDAAGLEVRKGKPAIGKKPEKLELQRLYIKEFMSIREIAAKIGCTKDMVYRALKEYGIQRRNQGEKRSQLQDYGLTFLKKEIKEKGYTQLAKELGVHNTTLRRYMGKYKSQK